MGTTICKLCRNNSPIGSCSCLIARCARSSVQIDPEYVRVICPDCNGNGEIKCDRGGVNCCYESSDGKTPCYCEHGIGYRTMAANIRGWPMTSQAAALASQGNETDGGA